MTDHPITPPPDLREQWLQSPHDALVQAARWGADQELEACCEWLGDAPVVYNDNGDLHPGAYLRDARRSKMRSLKEQALLAIDTAVADGRLSPHVSNVVRRALEQLDD